MFAQSSACKRTPLLLKFKLVHCVSLQYYIITSRSYKRRSIIIKIYSLCLPTTGKCREKLFFFVRCWSIWWYLESDLIFVSDILFTKKIRNFFVEVKNGMFKNLSNKYFPKRNKIYLKIVLLYFSNTLIRFDNIN